MDIPAYQIQNFLNAYSKQLCDSITAARTVNREMPPLQNRQKTAEGKRQAIIKMVANDIFERITRYCTEPAADGKTAFQRQAEHAARGRQKTGRNVPLRFKRIEPDNTMTCRTIAVDQADFSRPGSK